MKTKNTHPTLNINYSKEAEVLRVESVLEKADWYKKHGYADTVRLPGGITLSEIKENTTITELLAKIDREYDEQLFRGISSEIQSTWERMCKKVLWHSVESLSLTFQDVYEIHLTRYGTGGSYVAPNTITINIRDKNPKIVARIIFHEAIHLSIEPLVQKYNVPHWKKERLVDLVYRKILPEFSFMQKVPKSAHSVDKVFEKYSNNIELVIKNSA